MREIKFRGKRIYDEEWIYGSLISWPDGDIEIASFKSINEGNKHMVVPGTVGQFTGLRDKNGVDIYEGDLIHFAEKFLYVVKFEDAKFVGYHANNDWGKWGDLYMLGEVGFTKYNHVVIGNVHDNAELLTTAKGAVNYNMQHLDPGTKAEESNEQVTEQQAAQESASQDQATRASEEAQG